jgi:alpha-glucosidase
LRWLDSPPGVLAFARPDGFACVVNFRPDPVELPAHQAILLTSGPLPGGRLPTDTAAWLRTH